MKKFLILTTVLLAVGLANAAIDPIIGPSNGLVLVTIPIGNSAVTNQILSVPFEQCLGSGAPVMLSDLVSTLGLVASNADNKAKADQLVVLTTNSAGTLVYCYYYLTNNTMTWTAINSTLIGGGTPSPSFTPPDATNFPIARGKGFWLRRPVSATGGSLYLKGQVATANSTVTIKPGLNLISLGVVASTGLSVNDSSIGWGTGTGSDKRFAGDGIATMDKLYVVSGSDFDQYDYVAGVGWWNQDDKPGTILPGQGLWYLRKDSTDLTFTPVQQ